MPGDMDFLSALGLTEEEFDAELDAAEEDYEEVTYTQIDMQKAQQFKKLCSLVHEIQKHCDTIKHVTGGFLYNKEQDQHISICFLQSGRFLGDGLSVLIQALKLSDRVFIATPPMSDRVYLNLTVKDVYTG